jgi:hypothetical protein
VPPNLSKVHRKIESKNVSRIRFAVGYFHAEEGMNEFLTRKPFGWFIKGNEVLEVGVNQGKRLFEIQKLTSAEVVIPD